jgi:hypothetical protein
MSMGSIHVHEFISLDGVIDAPAQLALLPGTTHEGLLDRVEMALLHDHPVSPAHARRLTT